MDIGPISAVRAVPMVKPSRVDSDLSAVFSIEFRKRGDDETYSSSHQKASRGLEDEDMQDESDEGEESSTGESRPHAGASKISFFA